MPRGGAQITIRRERMHAARPGQVPDRRERSVDRVQHQDALEVFAVTAFERDAAIDHLSRELL